MKKIKTIIILGLICIVLFTIFISGCSEKMETCTWEKAIQGDSIIVRGNIYADCCCDGNVCLCKGNNYTQEIAISLDEGKPSDVGIGTGGFKHNTIIIDCEFVRDNKNNDTLALPPGTIELCQEVYPHLQYDLEEENESILSGSVKTASSVIIYEGDLFYCFVDNDSKPLCLPFTELVRKEVIDAENIIYILFNRSDSTDCKFKIGDVVTEDSELGQRFEGGIITKSSPYPFVDFCSYEIQIKETYLLDGNQLVNHTVYPHHLDLDVEKPTWVKGDWIITYNPELGD